MQTQTPHVTKVDFQNIYSVDDTRATLQWTAYKFTDKMAVNGTFTDFTLKTKKNTETIENLLLGSKIIIITSSVNSGAEIRDEKLRTYFFKVFNSGTIRGEITQANKGIGKVTLDMNNISNLIDYSYLILNDTLLLTTAINLSHWEGDAAMNTLNRECYELHMGADRISKLWPNVDITMRLPLTIQSLPE